MCHATKSKKKILNVYIYSQVAPTNKNALLEWQDMIYSCAEVLVYISAQLAKNYLNK